MAYLTAKVIAVLGVCLFQGSAAVQNGCAFVGEEESNSLYEDGDVVLGGLFPLHNSHASPIPTYETKPNISAFKYFRPRALRWMQTMIFAIGEINKRRDLLPNLRLGFHIRDSYNDVPVSLKRALLLVNGQPQAASGDKGFGTDGARLGCSAVHRSSSPVIVGDAASGVTVALLRTLGSFHIPVVSYFSSCSCLSSQRQFPTFMRTVPSDTFQVRALVRLVSHFSWTWVGVIGAESDYARFAIQLFLQESEQYGVCAAFVHFYPLELSPKALSDLLDVIQMSSSKVILNFSGDAILRGILGEFRRRNLTGLQWIASEAWATARSLWRDFDDILTGTLGFAIRGAVIPGLNEHLSGLGRSHFHGSAFLAEFWEETFDCRVNWSISTHSHKVDQSVRRPCNGTEDLDNVFSSYSDVSQPRVSYNVYKAIYLVAHALQDMTNCKPGEGPFQNGTCGNPKSVKPWQLLHYMRRARFSTLGETVDFDQNGDPIASYDLMNWQKGDDGSLKLVKVGFYDASSTDARSLVINGSAIQWHVGQQVVRSVCSESCSAGTRAARRKGKPVCCFDCVPCAEGEVSNQTDSLDCSRCPGSMWPNDARTVCLPKSVEFLSYHEPMGIVLCLVSLLGACASLAVLALFFKHRATPLVRANNMELSFLLLVFLAVCFLIGLLFIGEPSDWLCRVRYPAFGISFALCISCLLAKTVVVLMAFRGALPGSDIMKWFGPNQQRASVLVCTAIQGLICLVWLLTSPPHSNRNPGYLSATLVFECSPGSEVWFWCVLGYISLLACLCFLTAFLARKLPDNFNEAKFITFSVLIFFAVWITFIPVYVSTAGKYTVAVHIFAILASAFGLLLCIFAPKCYILLLKPERNSKKNMMRK